MGGKGEGELRATLEQDFDLIMRFWDSPKPTVSAVQGYCLGGGMEMALACDLTVAAENALFGEPEVSIASGVVALLLPWFTGPKLAKELLLTGDTKVPAERIYEMGLINRVVALDELRDTALKLAETIAMNDRLSVEITKRAINRSLEIGGCEKLCWMLSKQILLLRLQSQTKPKNSTKCCTKKGLRAQ